MPNLTHAPALYGLEEGIFAERLGPSVVVEPKVFVAGPSVIEALFAGELDVAYVGPNPALNAFMVSGGKALRIIAGSTSGGAQLVVRPSIQGPRDLEGERLASPALANTQDIALRTWLRQEGLVGGRGGEGVEVVPIAPSDVLRLYQQGQIAGAWLPEPWASRLVIQEGGKVLVDERSLWPGGEFPTTVVIASTDAIRLRPDLVATFVAAHADVISVMERSPDQARQVVSRKLREELGYALPPEVIDRAYTSLDFTIDPMPQALEVLARRAVQLGYLSKLPDIDRAVDRSYLP